MRTRGPGTDVDDFAIAYHEAGHYVVAHMFGHHQDGLTIEPDSEKGSLGHTTPMEDPGTFTYANDEERLERIAQEVCTLYAGFAAQIRVQPGIEERARLGARRDFEAAEGWLGREGLDDALMVRTMALIEEHWPAIGRLALALLAARTLDEAEAEAYVVTEDEDERDRDLARYRAYFKGRR